MKLPPLIAILRGLTRQRAQETGLLLYERGFRALEVPLNRKGALDSLAELANNVPSDCLIGAGTVLCAAAVDEAHARGARLIVAPGCDERVIARAIHHGLIVLPGVATPTEAIRALQVGASVLKAFPVQTIQAGGLRAWRSVLPPETAIFAVGGIVPETMRSLLAAGATGFGLGGELFQPSYTGAALDTRARRFMSAWTALQTSADAP
jgi:2-dehydro-3-deoxyphosphogalactonate aldolase